MKTREIIKNEGLGQERMEIMERFIDGLNQLVHNERILVGLANGRTFEKEFDRYFMDGTEDLGTINVKVRFDLMVGDIELVFTKFDLKTTIKKVIVIYDYFTEEIVIRVYDRVEDYYMITWNTETGLSQDIVDLEKRNLLHYIGFDAIGDIILTGKWKKSLIAELELLYNEKDNSRKPWIKEWYPIVDMYSHLIKYKEEILKNIPQEDDKEIQKYIPALEYKEKDIRNIVFNVDRYESKLQFEYENKTVVIFKNNNEYIPEINIFDNLINNMVEIPFYNNKCNDIKNRFDIIESRMYLVSEIMDMALMILKPENFVTHKDYVLDLDKASFQSKDVDALILIKKVQTFDDRIAELAHHENKAGAIEPGFKVFKINEYYKGVAIHYFDMEINNDYFPNAKGLITYKDYEIKFHVVVKTYSYSGGFRNLSVREKTSNTQLIHVDRTANIFAVKEDSIDLYDEIRNVIANLIIHYTGYQSTFSHNSSIFMENMYMVYNRDK